MPLGIERLNSKKSQPNPNIVFIKALAGKTEKAAQGFLERIAAQCVPIMRQHGIYVMSLEEYEPNGEFVGRNFNAGEVIQLVLKSPQTGRWLPHDYVQMVMMHELAHCKQMNHSGAFWAVRNAYAADMYKLWHQGYTGDGIWGRGANLGTGEWERNVAHVDEVAGHEVCGGTFRSRSSKRRRRAVLSYQERKQRRIAKKFGTKGMALGADDETKSKLEKGKRIQAKPRVASSARGRELRAAAALARAEQQKETEAAAAAAAISSEGTSEGEGDEGEGDSASGSDYGEDEAFDASSDVTVTDAVDVNGKRLLDRRGRGMVKVCGDETGNDVEVKKELDEVRDLLVRGEERRGKQGRLGGKGETGSSGTENKARPQASNKVKRESWSQQQHSMACWACSFVNSGAALTCAMCANVLAPDKATGSWRCQRATCRAASYANSADCGVCGLCGQPAIASPSF
ncbi:hypothetical protein CDD82_4635 [Ophiocordyceps australis]|uniref:WLM domain-containing protein n=1 Tax=Ophiocordyceps australis TaxID=1399860 RepID=A0A2C5Z6K7_9HYPO|nr:hypothetical protein CDD82_4635 [Ophiocordyceps australis]